MSSLAARISAPSVPDHVIAYLLTLLPPIELLRIVEMEEAERLSSLSADTLVREHADKIVKLSSRRNGMRVAHALMLNDSLIEQAS
jgi:hypothetical protein